MNDFVNTVDVIGDDALTDALIMRTITEFRDDGVTKLGKNALRGCSALTHIDLPNLSMIDTRSFNKCTSLISIALPSLKDAWGEAQFAECSKLDKVDFSILAYIPAKMFQYNSSLSTLILRIETQVCKLNNINAFEGTKIRNGTGYIYVPQALIEDYKVATNWSTLASKFRAIEDYPDICG